MKHRLNLGSALLVALLQEASVLAKDASLKGCSCLNQAVNLRLTICLTQLKVDSHIVAAGGNAPEECHGVIQNLLLVRTGGLGVDDCGLSVTNFTFQRGFLAFQARDQCLSV